MSNPFAQKGYVEKGGELVKLQPREQPPDISKMAMSEVMFTQRPSTDEAKLNKTEKAYLAYLRRLNPPFIGVQSITLKLADDCRLTADFVHLNENGRLVFTDVKGFQREDALIKMKMAARLFRMFDFVIVKKDGLSWATTKVNP